MSVVQAPERDAPEASRAAAVYRRFPDLQPTLLPATPAQSGEVDAQAGA